MARSRVLTGIIGAVFFLTLVSSVRADGVRIDMLLEKLIYAERHNLTVFDIQFEETGYLYTGHFENNNGKHLGFSMAAVKSGPVPEIVKNGSIIAVVGPQSQSQVSVSQNPEPAAMMLLGTGLAALGAFVRKRRRQT